MELLGERVQIERIGTDGDTKKAAQLYNDLDGQVDAFGVGGADLDLWVADKRYPFPEIYRMIAGVRKTPVVDGGGLQNTVEREIMQFVEKEIGASISPKRCLIPSAASRYGMAQSAVEAGYDIILGDMMFSLGLPIRLHTLRAVRRLARALVPVVTQVPLKWLYPTGDKQSEIIPKWGRFYGWASVIAGDFLYIKRHMPPSMEGKVIVTNTTTPADVQSLRDRGVAYLVTTTPRLEGRSFGTNAMEAALVALAGKGRPLTREELRELLDRLNYKPTLEAL